MPRNPRLVLIDPNGTRRKLEVSTTPFRMGRQAGNELVLRDSRISRQHSQIVAEEGKYLVEDSGSRHGTFVNGERIERAELHPNDTIDFGIPDSYRLIFAGEEMSVDELIERVERPLPTASSSRELYHLGVLLEVARALHTSLSLEDVLTSVVDAAIQVTHTERGVLLLAEQGEFRAAVARDAQHCTLPTQQLAISQSVLKQVASSRRELVVGDVEAGPELSAATSIAKLELHTVVAIPLEKRPQMTSLDSTVAGMVPELLGVLYLDSHAPTAAFSEIDRQVLRSLAGEGATVVENARLFAALRAKERLEQELKIASDIQQQLLPKTFPQVKHLSVAGHTVACQSVGGDCYDIIALPGNRFGFVVADVSGKGISAALLASMLQGAFSAIASLALPPDEVATRVNQRLCERTGEDRYVTLFYGVLHPDGHFEYVNAGHVPPLVKMKSGEIAPLGSDNFPIGMFDTAEYATSRIQLHAGDYVVMYTDGVTEAINTSNELFGEDRLRNSVESFSGENVQQFYDHVQKDVRAFTEHLYAQADDITLIVAQYLGR
jgi:phosphoserine phosphatase RsbU/P